MFTEIEAKLKVDSLRDVERNLTALGAEFIAEQLQTDYHFDDSAASLRKADRCLRLRRQRVGAAESFFLTYKGPKQSSSFKRRSEIEIEIKDGDSVTRLLDALGYTEVFVVEKKRCLWRLDDCLVALDRLPLLGEFVEIEGPDEKLIEDVQGRLGLCALPHIAESYASLMKAKLGRSARKSRDIRSRGPEALEL